MKISVQKEKLSDALQKLSNIIGTRTTLPILNNVLLKGEQNGLILETTDLDTRIMIKIEAEVYTPGATTVPAKKLLQFIKDFQSDKINFESDQSYHLKVEGGNSFYKLLGISPEDFPVPAQFSFIRKAVFSQSDLFRHLNLISYAVGMNDSRKILNGVLLSFKSGVLTTVATDGKRLAIVEKDMDKIDGSEGDVVIPLKIAAELQRILLKEGNIEIEIGEKQILFKTDTTTISSKLIEGTFPNYKQVIPTSFSKKIEIERENFLFSLRRIINITSSNSPFIKVLLSSGKVVLTADSSDIGEGKETIETKYSGQDLTVLFNPVHLSDPLRVMTSDLFTIQMNDGYGPVGITGDEGFLYIMMPIKNPGK
jgi:DNA polymerase-3 subunit beta